jgi:hypothetical protein
VTASSGFLAIDEPLRLYRHFAAAHESNRLGLMEALRRGDVDVAGESLTFAGFLASAADDDERV